MAPPQVTQEARRAFRSLSSQEMAELLADTVNAPLVRTALLIEFRRRFWQKVQDGIVGVPDDDRRYPANQ